MLYIAVQCVYTCVGTPNTCIYTLHRYIQHCAPTLYAHMHGQIPLDAIGMHPPAQLQYQNVPTGNAAFFLSHLLTHPRGTICLGESRGRVATGRWDACPLVDHQCPAPIEGRESLKGRESLEGFPPLEGFASLEGRFIDGQPKGTHPTARWPLGHDFRPNR